MLKIKKYLDKYSNDEKYDLFLNATNNSKAVFLQIKYYDYLDSDLNIDFEDSTTYKFDVVSKIVFPDIDDIESFIESNMSDYMSEFNIDTVYDFKYTEFSSSIILEHFKDLNLKPIEFNSKPKIKVNHKTGMVLVNSTPINLIEFCKSIVKDSQGLDRYKDFPDKSMTFDFNGSVLSIVNREVVRPLISGTVLFYASEEDMDRDYNNQLRIHSLSTTLRDQSEIDELNLRLDKKYYQGFINQQGNSVNVVCNDFTFMFDKSLFTNFKFLNLINNKNNVKLLMEYCSE